MVSKNTLHYIVCILSLLKVHTSYIFLKKKSSFFQVTWKKLDLKLQVQVKSSSTSTGSSQVKFRFSLTWNFKSSQVWTFSSFLDTLGWTYIQVQSYYAQCSEVLLLKHAFDPGIWYQLVLSSGSMYILRKALSILWQAKISHPRIKIMII